MLSLQAVSSSLNASTAKRGCLGWGEAFGCPLAVCPPKRPRPFARCRLWLHSTKSRFSGRGWGQQLFSFQSPAVQWMARTSSLNCLSCRNPYQTPDSLNCLPPFHWKPLFSLKSASSHPLPKNRLWWQHRQERGFRMGLGSSQTWLFFAPFCYIARYPENFCGFFLRVYLGILHW